MIALSALLLSHASLGDRGVDSSALREAVTQQAMMTHITAMASFTEAGGDSRESSSAAYYDTAEYIAQLASSAGFETELQEFDYPFFDVESAELARTTPNPISFTYRGTGDNGFFAATYSGAGATQAPVVAIGLEYPIHPNQDSTSGCVAGDFDDFQHGAIALLQRGGCSFNTKARLAEAAGAAGVVIFNSGNGRSEAFSGTLGAPGIGIPVVTTAFAVGEALASENTVAWLGVDAESGIRTSINLIADSPGGRDDRTVVAGAHLDSVNGVPGIQDNGSGSMALLEIALQMHALEIAPRNRVRFIWFGAEEYGAFGSRHYVGTLSKRELKDIALYLNFDMIASPNYAVFVYDGDASDGGIGAPNGSGQIERVFLDYFSALHIKAEPALLEGRSDYVSFTPKGIPIGGLFTGAEDLKTPAHASQFGGTEGLAYDPCYHLACDTLANVNPEALGLMADAAAHAILTFAMTRSAVKGSARANQRAHNALTYAPEVPEQ